MGTLNEAPHRGSIARWSTVFGQALESPNALCATAKGNCVTVRSQRTGSLVRRSEASQVDGVDRTSASQGGPFGGEGDGCDICRVTGEGRARHFQVDPRLYSALDGSKQPNNNFTKVMTWMASLRRNLTAQRNPLFTWFFNLMIDVSAAVVNHGTIPGRFFQRWNPARPVIKDPIYRANAGPAPL